MEHESEAGAAGRGGVAVGETPGIVDAQAFEQIVNTYGCFEIWSACHELCVRTGRECIEIGVEPWAVAVAEVSPEAAYDECFAEL